MSNTPISLAPRVSKPSSLNPSTVNPHVNTPLTECLSFRRAQNPRPHVTFFFAEIWKRDLLPQNVPAIPRSCYSGDFQVPTVVSRARKLLDTWEPRTVYGLPACGSIINPPESRLRMGRPETSVLWRLLRCDDCALFLSFALERHHRAQVVPELKLYQ